MDPAEAVERLTASPATTWYMPGDGAVLYAEVIHVEGTGSTVSAVILRPGKDKQVVGEWEGDVNREDDAEAAQAADEARRALAATLAGKELVPLAFTGWPEGKTRFDLTSPAVSLVWKDGHVLEATAGGRQVAATAVSVMEPHVPRPDGVYASADSPALLVAIDQDPGEAYTEGYNFFTEMIRIDLPR